MTWTITSRLWLIGVALAIAFAPAAARADRIVVDMAGRSVSVADHIGKVVTLGPVPVINSFVFAFGEANTIVNGLPPNFRTSSRWKYQEVFAPGLALKLVFQRIPAFLFALRCYDSRVYGLRDAVCG